MLYFSICWLKECGIYGCLLSYPTAFYLWLIVGCSVGGVLLLTVCVALLIYIRRRIRRSKKGSDLLDSTYIPGSEFCPQQIQKKRAPGSYEKQLQALELPLSIVSPPMFAVRLV
ncbi:hypothetical protein NPIL_407221 [Nephila pilipes]|uniref:Uncharacterized protein n=1 Tax=Nephila pilipes TaxID=299642 RepID=A0A8X6PWM9_NEPPI|nr:hypothetical protein NPIL_407221 [Nephila pilipes]